MLIYQKNFFLWKSSIFHHLMRKLLKNLKCYLLDSVYIGVSRSINFLAVILPKFVHYSQFFPRWSHIKMFQKLEFLVSSDFFLPLFSDSVKNLKIPRRFVLGLAQTSWVCQKVTQSHFHRSIVMWRIIQISFFQLAYLLKTNILDIFDFWNSLFSKIISISIIFINYYCF